jgi:hypothetical protein
MLKIVGEIHCQQTYIEFGEYLPFKFWCDSSENHPHLYWRTGNFDTSLIELEIEPISGKIIGAALILPGPIYHEFPSLNFEKLHAKKGFPVIDIKNWPLSRFEEFKKEFQIYVNVNKLLILFDDSISASNVIISQNISFGICDANTLVWILVSELSAENLNQFEKSVHTL